MAVRCQAVRVYVCQAVHGSTLPGMAVRMPGSTRQYVARQYIAVRVPDSTWQYVCQAVHGSTCARQYMAVRMPGSTCVRLPGSTWQYVARQYVCTYARQ